MSRRRPSRWHGLLPVAKRSGPTSHDVVDMARKALKERRIGHTGTLDPMAEGLLLLCVGRATRLQQFLLDWAKTYRGVVALGTATTTYDREGEPVAPSGPVPPLTPTVLASLQARFSGSFDQLPPPYSAKKVQGRKMYELARSGEEIVLEPKTVTVSHLALGLGDGSPPTLTVDVTASSGFYVRSLAHDIGGELGCGGHLCHLVRTAIGPYLVDEALPQSALEAAASPEEILASSAWSPLDAIALPFPSLDLNPTAADRFKNGQEVIVAQATPIEALAVPPVQGDRLVAVRGRDSQLIGVGVVQHVLARGRTLHVRPRLVLAE